MNNYERIKSMSIDDLAEFLDERWSHDNDPCIEWWDKTYCNKCKSVKAYVDYLEREKEYAWCEVNGDKCKFFPEMDVLPNAKQMMKLWLESEAE